MKLARRIFIDLMGVIVFISLFGTVLGVVLLSRALRGEAFARVRHDLASAHKVLDDELLHLSLAADLIVSGAKGGYDLPTKPDLSLLQPPGGEEQGPLFSYLKEEARLAFRAGERGYAVIPSSLLEASGFDASRLNGRSLCESGKTFWLYATSRGPEGYGFAGLLLNGNEDLVVGIQETLFDEGIYKGKPFGTVTIFCGDRRVATTVVGPSGDIALGTRVSEAVRAKVLDQGHVWLGRAYVVDDWYLSAYEPIRDSKGENAGILYVGALERKYADIQRRAVLLLSAITVPALCLFLLGVFYMSKGIVRPVAMLADASKRIENGSIAASVPADGRVDEIRTLALSFNSMSEAIGKRESMLRAANAELEEANRNYQELLSFVTHELNNSIGSLLLNVSILNDGTVGELQAEQREVSELVQRDLERFRDMVRNYLNISRLEKGTLKYNPAAINVRRIVVEPVLKRLKSRLEHRGMEVRLKWEGEPVVRADMELLDICYSNLLINAIKYGSDWVELSARERGGDWVFGVRNGGTPIPAEKIPLLFKKYSRLVRSDDGAGLGLYLVRQILERHGGDVWCESGEGEGTVFFMRIPLPQGGDAR